MFAHVPVKLVGDCFYNAVDKGRRTNNGMRGILTNTAMMILLKNDSNN